jgi:hypothetical protein
MRENAIFRLSSLSKPIVSATALAMVERGQSTQPGTHRGLSSELTLHMDPFALRPRASSIQAPILQGAAA